MSTEEQNDPCCAAAESSPGDDLQARLEEAERERNQFHDLFLRERADSLNLKRRAEEEREELQRQANANLVLRLLPVLDDFERALQHAPQDDGVSSWLAGVELVARNLLGVMESFGVTRIAAQDAPFDPAEHESVSSEICDTREEGIVLSVIREGYRLHGKVLRPAQVTVSKKS